MPMATMGETINQASHDIETTALSQDEQAVVANMRLLVDEMRGAGTTGKQFFEYNEDELSRIAGSLGVLMPNLGSIIANLTRDLRVSTEVIDFRKASLREPAKKHLIDKKKVLKPTADDVRAEITIQLFQDNLRLAFKEQKMEEVKHLWWAVRSILGVIEQRIQVLQGERRGMRFGQNGGDFYQMANPGLKKENN